ncbi:hypothetical protein SDRG_07858 [Saprolegnia diclina VS20]|uniref:Uncharacterized protein n=1 Tax=Saprolegnia diclina (strain VS20) TaxID=1156394 RepID=T0QL58_SAPDV|nr:hypothetical protein SDRG_07858 [Saprolegnia diclina VS20]EQC34530.1 hypothetical protein SDRG_07858 [Saprolegnia diclina VS20]|eukprot:XP_008611936.1 hypothetical protein SDRG_07858 [Saprolegnia diclina VS20]
MADDALSQVEDEIRLAEAYLQQRSAPPSAATPPKLSEARRKEILAKLQDERRSVLERKKTPTVSDDLPWTTSFLDTAARFPLPSPTQQSFTEAIAYDNDDGKAYDSDSDDGYDNGDDDMSFLKELQEGDDTLYFASELPATLPRRPSTYVDDEDDQSAPASVTSSHTSPTKPLPKAVRFDIDFAAGRQSGTPPTGIAKRRAASAPRERSTASHSPPMDPECTFRPKTTPYKGSKVRATGPSRLSQLAAPRSAEYAKREKLKMEQELASLSSCTFTPNAHAQRTPEKHVGKTNKMAFVEQQMSPNPKRVKVDDVTERLYGDGLLRYELRAKVKRALEDRSVRATCTFTPKINAVTRAMVDHTQYKPIQDRVPEIQRRKKEVLRQLATSVEDKLTFVPAINEKSRQLTQQLGHLSVTDRLAQDAEDNIEKRQIVEELYTTAQGLSFAPQVNERSHSIVDHKPEFKLDFVTRQRVLQDRRDDKLEHQMLLEEKVNAIEQPFQPCIGNAEKVLKHTRPKRLTESTPEQLYRMTYAEPRKKAEQKKRLEEAYYNKFSYQPKLNHVSKALGRATPIQKLAKSDAAKPIRSRVIKEMELRTQAECRFRPAITPLEGDADRSTVWNPATVIQTIERTRERRRQSLEDKRHLLEFEELQRCTFQPTINRKPISASEAAARPVVVRGLSRFLELKQRAKRQEEELREREAKVFGTSYTPRAYTIPAPFKLSYQDRQRDGKRSRLEAELRQKEMQECTFAPMTMEVKNRKLIQSLLRDGTH